MLAALISAIGESASGISQSAGLARCTVPRWLDGGGVQIQGLEQVLSSLRCPLSQFAAMCEREASGKAVAPSVLERMVRPSRSWQDAIAQAVACLTRQEFGGGVLQYGGRWVALVPVERTVRIHELKANSAGLRELGNMLAGEV